MRCIRATSKPDGPSSPMNSKGGSGRAAPTFKGGALFAARAAKAPVADRGNAASKWRRVIFRPFVNAIGSSEAVHVVVGVRTIGGDASYGAADPGRIRKSAEAPGADQTA